MWSLPNIKEMNKKAKSKTHKQAIKKAKKVAECICKDWGHNDCEGEIRSYDVYDIFSDDVKDVVSVCEKHDGYTGTPAEGYFMCADCGRIMAENYTWEKYYTIIDGEQVCLNCARERVLSKPESWITLSKCGIEAIDFEYIKHRPHVIAVGQDEIKGLKFVGNSEFDSMSGESISGGGLEGLKQMLYKAKKDGAKKAILILDGGYQFATSIGCYILDR